MSCWDGSLKLGGEARTSLTEYWKMELEAQGSGYFRMDLFCDTRESILASVPWESPDNISFTKAIQNAL